LLFGVARPDSFPVMRLVRHFVVISCALALICGSTLSFATMALTAVTACEHGIEQADHRGAHPLQHRADHGVACVTCCLGACTAVGLPSHPLLKAAAFSVAMVAYWETAVSLADRSVAPDPDPPRTSA
jgi:hypothetical protein